VARLASRSPAAPFSTSRPAPMPQYPPQATKTTEAQTLRQMVQEREEEIQRLRSEAESAYTMLDRYANEVSDEAYRQIESHLIDALDGGGGDNE
jgi:hypothetical protein